MKPETLAVSKGCDDVAGLEQEKLRVYGCCFTGEQFLNKDMFILECFSII